MLGVSVYLSQDIKEIKEYLEKMASMGVKTVFTSMHILEEDTNQVIKKIEQLSKIAIENNLDLTVDISNNTLEKYEMNLDQMIHFFKRLKIINLRADYGFSLEELSKISKNFSLVLNASTINNGYCDELEKAGVDLSVITACHNFYPRPETGLSEDFLDEKTQFLKSKGFKVQAFIPGDKDLRGPIYEGLPTLEKHRKKNPLYSYIHLKEKFAIDEIIIGDLSVKEATLSRIMYYEKENTIILRVENIYPKIRNDLLEVLKSDHINREDFSPLVVRSTKSRLSIKNPIEEENTIERKKGSITFDNKNYLRYNGELQIALFDLPADNRVNVVANIVEEDLDLLNFLKNPLKFKFKF